MISNLSVSIAQLTSLILTLLFWAIFIRAILSWVNPDPFTTPSSAFWTGSPHPSSTPFNGSYRSSAASISAPSSPCCSSSF